MAMQLDLVSTQTRVEHLKRWLKNDLERLHKLTGDLSIDDKTVLNLITREVVEIDSKRAEIIEHKRKLVVEIEIEDRATPEIRKTLEELNEVLPVPLAVDDSLPKGIIEARQSFSERVKKESIKELQPGLFGDNRDGRG